MPGSKTNPLADWLVTVWRCRTIDVRVISFFPVYYTGTDRYLFLLGTVISIDGTWRQPKTIGTMPPIFHFRGPNTQHTESIPVLGHCNQTSTPATTDPHETGIHFPHHRSYAIRYPSWFCPSLSVSVGACVRCSSCRSVGSPGRRPTVGIRHLHRLRAGQSMSPARKY